MHAGAGTIKEKKMPMICKAINHDSRHLVSPGRESRREISRSAVMMELLVS